MTFETGQDNEEFTARYAKSEGVYKVPIGPSSFKFNPMHIFPKAGKPV